MSPILHHCLASSTSGACARPLMASRCALDTCPRHAPGHKSSVRHTRLHPWLYSDLSVDNSGVLPITEALLFPGFDPSTVSQREWKPADDTGRIKLEVSAGHATDLHGFMKFTKLSTVVCFSFFPAPMGRSAPALKAKCSC